MLPNKIAQKESIFPTTDKQSDKTFTWLLGGDMYPFERINAYLPI